MKTYDSTVKLPTKKLTDSGRSSDSLSRVARWYRTVSDLGKSSDIVVRAVVKVSSDIGKSSDYIKKTPSKNLTDAGKSSDSISRVVRWVRSASDVGKSSDRIFNQTQKKLTDSSKVSDKVSKLAVRCFYDVTKSSDSLSKLTYRVVKDYAVGENVASALRGKTLYDTAKSSDSVSKTPAKVLAESCRSIDQISKVARFYRFITDISKAYDTISRQPSKLVSDSGRLSDSFSRKITVYRPITDIAKSSDRSSKLSVKGLTDVGKSADYLRRSPTKKLVDTSKPYDTVSRVVGWVRSASDVGKSSDKVVRAIAKEVIETSRSYDRLSRFSTKVMLDVYKAVDLVSRGSVISVVDYLVGEYSSLTVRGKTFYETVRLADNLTKQISWVVSDYVMSADRVERGSLMVLRDLVIGEYQQSISNVRQYSDVFRGYDVSLKNVGKHALDVVGVSDIATRLVRYLRSLTEISRVLDSTARSLSKGLVDVGKAADYIYRKVALFRYLYESGIVSDVLSKSQSKVVQDASRLVDWVLRSRGVTVMDVFTAEYVQPVSTYKSLLDTQLAFDRVSKQASKLFADSGLPKDYIRTSAGFMRSIYDLSKVYDRILTSRSVVVGLRDIAGADYGVSINITLTKSDELFVSDYYRRVISKLAVDSVAVLEKVSVYRSVLRILRDVFGVEYWTNRIITSSVLDTLKSSDTALKVGYTLFGEQVMRVYSFPPELRSLWDIIRSADHNAKVDACYKLLTLLKDIASKMGLI